MDMVVCPHCGTRVVLRGDRTCPSCRRKPDVPAAVPVASGLEDTTGRTSAEPTDFNPYQAPLSAPSSPTEEMGAANLPGESGGKPFKFYSPGQVGGATFLGSPMAGFWLLASNYRSLGEGFQAKMTLFVGVAITTVISALSIMLPDRPPSTVIFAVCTWFAYQIAKQLQGKSYNKHMSLGGQKHSNWRVVGIAIICLMVLIVVASLVVAIILSVPGTEGWIEE